MMVQEHGIEAVDMACELALEQGTTHLPIIVNLVNQLVEPMSDPLPKTDCYPSLEEAPRADCKRYEQLCTLQEASS